MRLFYRSWEIDRPSAACILVHGLGEHGGRYTRLAEALTRTGYSVWIADHRGHGRSIGQRGDCVSTEILIEDLHLLVELVANQHPALARVMIGHSLGGLLAIAYAAQHPEQLRAVAVSSPALGIGIPLPLWKPTLVRALARILPRTPVPNGVDPSWVSRDPAVVSGYRNDPLVHRVVSARCAVALERSILDSPAQASRLKTPCLILQAGEDKICDAQASQRFALSVQQAPVTFRRYDGLYHELFNEPEKDRVIEDLLQWLRETLR